MEAVVVSSSCGFPVSVVKYVANCSMYLLLACWAGVVTGGGAKMLCCVASFVVPRSLSSKVWSVVLAVVRFLCSAIA